MTVCMGFCSAPARALIVEGVEFAEDFLLLDLEAAATLSAVSFDEVFALTIRWAFGLPPLLFFFSASSAPSAVRALRFSSARAIAFASQAAFTFPRDAGRLLVHSADFSSPPICAIVRPVRTEVSYVPMSNPATT